MEESSPKRKVSPILVILGATLAVVVISGFTLGKAEPKSYSFVTVDHPVDMWQDSKDKWVYYSVGEGTTKDLAERARNELTPLGFVEDKSKQPWFRFAKGTEEVVVCNHHEFAVNAFPTSGSKLVQTKPGIYPPGTTQEWPCVLVKNGPGTHTSLQIFNLKKLIHGW